MKQTAIPYLFLRGGTSRGPYFQRADLPEDREMLSAVLNAVMGSGHPLNINGLGGSATVTTKVVMLSPGTDGWADVDYFFAQVDPMKPDVDYRPTCGNMLSGVGPAALEMGLVKPKGDETQVKIRAVNTGARIEAVVQTPGGQVRYDGDAAIDGVPGTAAPILLNFMDTVGSVCGSLLPSGKALDVIDGIEVTLMDVAMPMMIARAADFGLTGYETVEEINGNTDALARIESVRLKAGPMMNLGEVSKSVTPKVGLLAKPRAGGAVSVRYLTPWACHPTLAVTGSQCLAACLLTPGTVADGLATPPTGNPALVTIEHPMGEMLVTVDRDDTGIRSAGLLRTARLLARGEVMVPGAVWARPGSV
jgi:4-oxalomesaconate tautomerase